MAKGPIYVNEWGFCKTIEENSHIYLRKYVVKPKQKIIIQIENVSDTDELVIIEEIIGKFKISS